jgi:hypothetical protein
MPDKLRAALDEFKRRLREMVADLEEVLAPAPELVPVPVKPRAGSRAPRRR